VKGSELFFRSRKTIVNEQINHTAKKRRQIKKASFIEAFYESIPFS
jgi:hypothetical protein